MWLMRIWRLFFVFLWQFWNEPMGWFFFLFNAIFLLFFKVFCKECITISAVESCHLLLINFRTCLKLMLLGFSAVLKMNTSRVLEVDLKSTKKYQHDTRTIEPMQPLPLPPVQWWRCVISGWAVNFPAIHWQFSAVLCTTGALGSRCVWPASAGTGSGIALCKCCPVIEWNRSVF